VRPQPFITASKNVRAFKQEQIVDGLTFIFMGFFYKIAIADPLFATLQSSTTNLTALSSADAWAAFILYTVRIYADFAGYSLLAIGVSVWFGMPIVENFRQPYFSRTVSIFWDRWHISLSTWIRDYIFYPISRFLLRRWGNQRARLIQVIALLIAMTLSGMWHGTGWTFVVWGALYGVYLSIERVFFPRAKIKPKKTTWLFWLKSAVGLAITLAAVSAAWVFFRADSVADALIFFQRLFSSNPFTDITLLWWIKVLVPIGLLLLIDLPQALGDNALILWRLRPIWRVTLCTVLLLGIFIFGSQTHAPFIYAGF
jgi:D-alanyl-lipoteichoic acid acyltransferase DltB (MBOAT superfamily)